MSASVGMRLRQEYPHKRRAVSGGTSSRLASSARCRVTSTRSRRAISCSLPGGCMILTCVTDSKVRIFAVACEAGSEPDGFPHE